EGPRSHKVAPADRASVDDGGGPGVGDEDRGGAGAVGGDDPDVAGGRTLGGAWQAVDDVGVVEPLGLVVDAARLGQRRDGAGGEVQHGQAPVAGGQVA